MFFAGKGAKAAINSADEKPNWWFRSAVVVTILLVAASAAAFSWNVKPGNGFGSPPKLWEIRVLDILKAFECLYFGVSVAFAVFVGHAVSQVAPQMRFRMVSIYLCMCWLLVSWFPHVTLHSFYPTYWGLITLDLCFHMTVVLASLFLTYFIFRLIQAAARVKLHRLKDFRLKTIVQSAQFRITVITFVIGCVFFGIGFAIPPHGLPPTPLQARILRGISFFEALLLGLAVAFMVEVIPLIRKIPQADVRRKAVVMLICITWIVGNWWPHIRLHSIVDDDGYQIPKYLISIDIVFHWTVMGASVLMCYVLYGVILLGVNYSKSPFRDSTGSNNSSHASQGTTALPESEQDSKIELTNVSTQV